ncbi:hypothetical protein F9U64_01020 [Gracilibacillus oryzae]|uniref:Gas vesicle protein GvpP n=1 Tax=Gracilibacillus oryzae TaxID=1672701 RepID=A0A7C8GVN2_9BACI|nr:hypothetical protein [Gracilibacillus oryzae]KAB8139236.1 hypothetical protein F9U64_01020 [Gracilibacillus oryzae]
MAEQKTHHASDNGSSNSIKYILLGGVAGAGVGLLSNPGTVQTLYHKVQVSETGQKITKELGRNLQQLITQQAIAAVQQAAPDYLHKAKKKFSSSESEGNEKEKDANYEEIKQENRQINQRLENIEQKLEELLKANDQPVR